jgi:hypothetical protein
VHHVAGRAQCRAHAEPLRASRSGVAAFGGAVCAQHWASGSGDEMSPVCGSQEPYLISMDTTRYSEIVRRIVERYGREIEIEIDAMRFAGDELSSFLETHCTNDRLTKTRNFVVRRGTNELFGFHDHPREFWAVASEGAFLQELANERLVRLKPLRRAHLSPVVGLLRIVLHVAPHAVVLFLWLAAVYLLRVALGVWGLLLAIVLVFASAPFVHMFIHRWRRVVWRLVGGGPPGA